ncbi:MAG: hypothetical protein FWG79_09145 [Bacteroidales bacterium]|nr:hypothetical protein [Bacteroidales bacterium]
MRKNFIPIVCFLGLVIVLESCSERNRNPIPDCMVNFMIDRSSTEILFGAQHIKTFNNSNSSGYTGCYGDVRYGGGVVVVNINDVDFLAYDMACPYDHYYGGMIVKFQISPQPIPTDTEGRQVFECSHCKTKFDVMTGGAIKGGATKYPLKRYTVAPGSVPLRFFVQN